MRRLHKPCLLMKIYIFLMLLFAIDVSDAQPILVSDDGQEWIHTSDLIFEREVKGFHQVNVDILNLTPEYSGFKWKTDKVDDYIQVDFIMNGQYHDSCKNNTLSLIAPFEVGPNDKFRFKIWDMTSNSVKISIAFPPVSVESNNPPSMPEVLSGPSDGYAESFYGFSVRSSDPDGDMINYTFYWEDNNISHSGFLASGETATGYHSWGLAGDYIVTVVATDEHGANSSLSMGHRTKILSPSALPILNSPPNVPEVLSGPSDGYAEYFYDFSVKSSDPDGDMINYTFYWGDNNTSHSGFLRSGETATGYHSWGLAGDYIVTVVATDEHGANSSLSTGHKTRILWLVRVLPGESLQTAIDGVKSNTIVLLEGGEYAGPINITKSSIIISSNCSRGFSTIRSQTSDSVNYTIGLINSDNVTIEKLNLEDGLYEIYVERSVDCNILNNTMLIKKCGIYICNVSNNNSVIGNSIGVGTWLNLSEGRIGISVKNSGENIISCNAIEGLSGENDWLYTINNSSLSIFKLDSSSDGRVFYNRCCYNYTHGIMINRRCCILENGSVSFCMDGRHDMDCLSELELGGC